MIAAGWAASGTHRPDDGCNVVCRRDDFIKWLEGMLNYVAVEEPVKGGVAMDADLREYDEVGSVLFGLFDGADDAGGVAFEVSVGGVDLTDRNAHL